jgi:hypothetical protein
VNAIGTIAEVHAPHARAALSRGGEVHPGCDHQITHDLAATVLQLRQGQMKRSYCIKCQSRCDRSLDALIVQGWGYNPEEMTEAERKAMFARAASLRIAIERLETARIALSDATPKRAPMLRAALQRAKSAVPDYADNALATDLPQLVKTSAMARSAYDDMREATEARMENLAMTLPVWPWAKTVRGFGVTSAKGLAVIVGLAPGRHSGALGDFATKERLWKRLGLSVINGRRQGNPGPLANAADWTEHAHNKLRRSELWVIGTNLFRAQWRGDKDADGKDPRKSGKPVAVPAHAIGPYGEVYARRRAHTEPRIAVTAHLPNINKKMHPDRWTPKRCHNDAVRIMTKQLVEDLWRAWRRATPGLQTISTLPAANPIGARVPVTTKAVLPRGRRANLGLQTTDPMPSAQPSKAIPP